MKNVLNRVLLISFMFGSLFSFSVNVNSIEFIKDEDMLKVYDIKEKEEVLRTSNNNIINFYEKTHEEVENLIEQKRIEEERLAKERRINKKKELVSFAKRFIGRPYVRGGNSLTNGTDCSGFVKLVYAQYGVTLPRTTTGQAKSGESVSIDDIEVGDIISYGYNGHPSHSALYIGNGRIVHASTPQRGILTDSMYIMPIITIRRVM